MHSFYKNNCCIISSSTWVKNVGRIINNVFFYELNSIWAIYSTITCLVGWNRAALGGARDPRRRGVGEIFLDTLSLLRSSMFCCLRKDRG